MPPYVRMGTGPVMGTVRGILDSMASILIHGDPQSSTPRRHSVRVTYSNDSTSSALSSV